MAMAIPSAATLQERVPMASDSFSTEFNLYQGRSVHVCHGISISIPDGTLAYDGTGDAFETQHATRFDAYVAALQHIAGML